MLTSNIDISAGLVNGAIGYLKYIEYDIDDNILRLWPEFENKNIGKLLRTKYYKLTSENSSLKTEWIPISKRSVYINSKN